MTDNVAPSPVTSGRVIADRLNPDELHKLGVTYAGHQSRP